MIRVNGRQVEHIDGETVTGLLTRMSYVFPLVIVRIDGAVIPFEMFSDAKVPDGANVEVLHLTSGG
ncbi:MAG: sulfur carrier protein ThiS [Thermoplasmata archaeon]|nr:sulfur carrier protein ThiS [Thermoplasmata archaeon]